MSDPRIWVFAGPSLPPAARPAGEAFCWRPPAVAGDAVAAADARPRAVVLIDGLFDLWPAIRHKELLDLIDAGVPVLGAASMGALRAAELHPLGMTGVGAIFRAYASGRIVADDEVAVLHGPEEMGWAPLTIPQVNVRATLARALRQRVVSGPAARALRDRSASVFFQDRSWRGLLHIAAAEAVAPAAELARLSAWLPGGQVDQKRRDALEALAVAAALPAVGAAAARSAETVFAAALAKQVRQGSRPDPASS
jgi:hypothetical protein